MTFVNRCGRFYIFSRYASVSDSVAGITSCCAVVAWQEFCPSATSLAPLRYPKIEPASCGMVDGIMRALNASPMISELKTLMHMKAGSSVITEAAWRSAPGPWPPVSLTLKNDGFIRYGMGKRSNLLWFSDQRQCWNSSLSERRKTPRVDPVNGISPRKLKASPQYKSLEYRACFSTAAACTPCRFRYAVRDKVEHDPVDPPTM